MQATIDMQWGSQFDMFALGGMGSTKCNVTFTLFLKFDFIALENIVFVRINLGFKRIVSF